MLTVLADENIANIDDYLHHHDIKVIKLKGRDINRDALLAHQPDALFIRSVTQVSAANLGELSALPLKFIGSATIGTDHVDTDFLAQHGISFSNAAGCSKHSVAQYVITAILHTYPSYRSTPIRLGIIGLGNIGSTLADYAKKLGWQVVGFDPFLPPSDINTLDFQSVLNCDAISIHTPLTRTGTHPTFNLINADTLAQMQPNALLINTARGEIIDEAALLGDIARTHRKVILDVFPSEPAISTPLMDALHLTTSHIAGYTLEGKLRGTDMIYQAFCQSFGITPIQKFEPLLPPNPYRFDDLIHQLGGSDTDRAVLAQFYDIAKDDTSLRAVCTDMGVQGADFDYLRKTYQLRREWL
ncbi:4-phosphoerythronate dehydrogenase [Moraxella sp. RCAD0137]|uniref:4-phosphoerythronate dehydrogenase n=1 Tax=Moraxella sp. RCAD0137 TaxID=1775913 RepID=UPI000C9FC6B5|nr:4-phosphoerythronate dehydrogenase [Moraxella sp. RCAD0137]PNP98342.1 erythronate-4-phosphate dehydrogenase [Moraxella sp. RCAD0137]